MNLKTREQLRELNAQDWADFKAHWPMRVFNVLGDFFLGVFFGFVVGVCVAAYAVEKAFA